MKINFNNPFKDFRGQVVLANGKPVMMADEVGRTLYNAGASKQLTAEEKYDAYKICTRIATTDGEVDITAEDGALIIRLCADNMTAGAFGQIKDLIEK